MAADAAMGLKNFSSDLGLKMLSGIKAKVELYNESVVLTKEKRKCGVDLIMPADYNDIDRRTLI